jgi:predicted metal-dependent hydrolase
LQIAVACYHLHNHNWQGAAILLGEGMGRLRYYQPVYGEIDVSELLQQSNNLLQLLQTVGSEGVVDFVERLRQDPTPLPVLKFFTSLDKVLGARCDYYTSIENRNAECGVKYIHRDLDATMSDLTIS